LVASSQNLPMDMAGADLPSGSEEPARRITGPAARAEEAAKTTRVHTNAMDARWNLSTKTFAIVQSPFKTLFVALPYTDAAVIWPGDSTLRSGF
jgi:hypothetical protein